MPNAPNVRVGVTGIDLGATSGNAKLQPPVPREAEEGSPLLADARDNEITRELESSTILNGGTQLVLRRYRRR